MKIEDLVRDEIKTLKPYHVKDYPVRIKLDANESTYSLPQEFLDELLLEIRNISFNRYPDPSSLKLREVISRDLGVDKDCLLIGNGSDELIQSIILTFGGTKERILFPVPTFAMYEILSTALGQVSVKIPLDEEWDLDMDRIKESLSEENPKIVFLSYPNNPTGNCFSEDRILEIIDLSKGIVVVDEAYHDFARKSFLDRLKDYKNLIVLRSLSKIGMAGLRVGMMIADREMIKQVAKVKLPYNVNIISQVIARFILSRKEVVEEQVALVIEERERLLNEMGQLESILSYPTDSNFILFKEKGHEKRIWDNLLKHGILIRDLSKSEFLADCLRVTVGQKEENTEFLKVLKEV